MDAAYLAELFGLPTLPLGLSRVEDELSAVLAVDQDDIEVPARRVVLGGGKRLRPALALAVAAASSEHPERAVTDRRVVTGAVAVELVQAGSLVHDDIMDGAKERRGVPTINAVEGPNHAILVGDFLLARAGQLAATVSREVAGSLADAIADLCRGQSLEVSGQFVVDRSVDAYERSIGGKTAALFRTACEIGALCGDATPALTRAVATYGFAFGMAFQIVDDVLDIASTTEALGKPAGNDVREGVYSLPVLMALAGPDGHALRARLGSVPSEDTVRDILGRVRSSGALEEALARARHYNDEAVGALATLPPSSARSGLAELPAAYLAWVIDDKAPGLAVSAP